MIIRRLSSSTLLGLKVSEGSQTTGSVGLSTMSDRGISNNGEYKATLEDYTITRRNMQDSLLVSVEPKEEGEGLIYPSLLVSRGYLSRHMYLGTFLKLEQPSRFHNKCAFCVLNY